MIKVEISPGKKRLSEEWETIGIGGDIDKTFKWGRDKFPYKKDSVDIIYASHVLEHIWWYDTVRVLEDALEVLKPGGRIELWVPNFSRIAASYYNRECGDKWRKWNPNNEYMTWVNGRLFAYGSAENTHRACFDGPHLVSCLQKAGYDEIFPLRTPRGVSHGIINLGMCGVKEKE